MSTLLQGDCLELMKSIPDGSVDMVLTDPPYGTTACKWDNVIPLEPMWKELKRITKPSAAICLFGSEPFSSSLRMSNLKQYKYDWVWIKNNPSNYLDAKKRPMGIYECISVFKDKKEPYYPQGLVEINKTVSCPDKTSNRMFDRSNKARKMIFQQFTNYPKNVLSFKKEGRLHTSQKPVALLEYLIKTYTLEGETVLDFTMGSGSTGVACKNLNRKFIGIEKEQGYFETAKKRILEFIKDESSHVTL